MQVRIEPHPLLDAACFVTEFSKPLAEQASHPSIGGFFEPEALAPLSPSDEVKLAVRDLLRVGGFKPSGRSKPACEYLIKAIEKGWLAPDKSINPAVDTCNAVSLHSGLPISVVDVQRASGDFFIDICPEGTSYIFNPSDQVIDIGGLISLHDELGPCAGPVKDSQRTKTHEGTTQTLTIIWGTQALPGRTKLALDWYRELLQDCGAISTILAPL
jgi:DNA/RNA-binding domain of Phe-tRNA-synthetase-like protein